MIDAIGIADEGVGDSAEIQKAIPVGIVAREPRDFEAEYNADMAESDFGSKSGKAIARHDTGSGNAKIFVDNDNLLRRPSKCGCFGGQRALAEESGRGPVRRSNKRTELWLNEPEELLRAVWLAPF